MERFVNNKNALHIALKPHAESKYTLTRSHGKAKIEKRAFYTVVDLLEYTVRKKETLTDVYTLLLISIGDMLQTCYTIHNRSSQYGT